MLKVTYEPIRAAGWHDRAGPTFLGILRDQRRFNPGLIYVILRASGMMSSIFAVLNAMETIRYGH